MSDDIYPVPEEALPSVAAYADVTVQGSGGRVPWLVLQMAPVRPQLGERDRPPTIAEVRCMTYLALAHGVTGLLYYSFNERPGYDWRIPETAPALWAQYADLTAELRTLAPALLAPAVSEPVEVTVTQGPSGPGPWNYPALHTSLRRTETGYFLLAVNGLAESVTAELRLPVTAEEWFPQAAVRFENRLVEVQQGTITDSFGPYGVHLYDLCR
jgi:hypothetical protein